MATLPWTTNTAPDSSADTVVLGSRLELRSLGDTVRFLRAALQVRTQVLASPGAIGVSLIAQPAHKTYWTLSAWTDQDALDAFVRTTPHLDVMRRFHDRLERATFTTWSVPAADLPKARSRATELWRVARERLAASEMTMGGDA